MEKEDKFSKDFEKSWNKAHGIEEEIEHLQIKYAIDKQMKEKEFNLSEKRKELYELHKNVIPKAFMLLIEKQDKEFIRRFKEEIDGMIVSIKDFEEETWRLKVKKKLDKLTGEK